MEGRACWLARKQEANSGLRESDEQVMWPTRPERKLARSRAVQQNQAAPAHPIRQCCDSDFRLDDMDVGGRLTG